MKPASAARAGREAAVFCEMRLSGISKATRRRRIARADAIAQRIWKRWGVGIRGWKLKHARWFLTHATRDQAQNTRYQYFLILRWLVEALGKPHWVPMLSGCWTRPNDLKNGTSDARKSR